MKSFMISKIKFLLFILSSSFHKKRGRHPELNAPIVENSINKIIFQITM